MLVASPDYSGMSGVEKKTTTGPHYSKLSWILVNLLNVIFAVVFYLDYKYFADWQYF